MAIELPAWPQAVRLACWGCKALPTRPPTEVGSVGRGAGMVSIFLNTHSNSADGTMAIELPVWPQAAMPHPIAT